MPLTTTRRLTTLATLTLIALTLGACGETEFKYDSASYFPEDWKSSYTQISGCSASKSTPHGGNYVQIWADPNSKGSFGTDVAVPEGGVLLKPQFEDSSCETLAAFTVMRRRPDDGGDKWDWQRVEADGSISGTGKQPFCISCHQACNPDTERCTP